MCSFTNIEYLINDFTVQTRIIQLPIMIAIRHKLQELTTWLQHNQIQIEEYIARYPFVQFKQMQASNLFKNKLGQIISLIIKEIVPPTTFSTSFERLGRNLHENATQINNLCIIKRNLDQIKCAFLGLDNLKSFNTHLILKIIQESIHLTNEDYKAEQKNQKFQPFKYSIDPPIIAHHKKIYQQKLKSWSEQYRHLNEDDKTQKIRAELYAQMNEYLTKKEKDLKQKREKKSFSHYFGGKEKGFESLQTSNKKQEEKQRKRIFPSNYQSEKHKIYTLNQDTPNKNTKRKYKYLQDLDQVQFKPTQKPINYFSIQKASPKENQLKLLSTTDSNKHNQHSELQIELSKFQAQKQLQSSINMQLNFDFLLNKIRQEQKNEVHEPETWQIFDQDSIQKQKQAQNLQDSLQMMKAEQKLNNTGYFGVKQQKIIELQNHQYSFSKQ